MDMWVIGRIWPCMVGYWAGNNWLVSDSGLYAMQFPSYGGDMHLYGAYLL